MPVNYVSVEEAMEADGLRMIVVGGTASPWGEAAKGILHVKNINWLAVRLDYKSETLKNWAGQRAGPVAFYNDERPRTSSAEILLLAERLAPSPPLLPKDAADRALVVGLSHEIHAEGGLGWTRRLQLVDAGLKGEGGFSERVAQYLARKYGYRAEEAPSYTDRVTSLLAMLADRLKSQGDSGSRYLVGTDLTAADIYCAAFMGLFSPLPPEHSPDETQRDIFNTLDEQTKLALDPILLQHRDRIYEQHLELPLSL
ncbi:MAG: hypothetical protein AB3N20_07415 [Rhizobiaceae bacterium]